MANTQAVLAVQAIYQHVDDHVRELLPAPPGVEVDTINVLIGDGVNVLATGVAAALRVDFRARITGAFLQEIDGTTGSVVIAIAKSQGDASPTWTSIVASAPPTISSGRYSANETLTGWTTEIERGDYLRFSVTSATAFTRLLIALRIRRLEP